MHNERERSKLHDIVFFLDEKETVFSLQRVNRPMNGCSSPQRTALYSCGHKSLSVTCDTLLKVTKP